MHKAYGTLVVTEKRDHIPFEGLVILSNGFATVEQGEWSEGRFFYTGPSVTFPAHRVWHIEWRND